MTYSHKDIDKKWQKKWEESQCFKVKIDYSKPKFYALDMFPYPSGLGLHIGHLASYIPTEVMSRYKIMRGFNVLHPMGYDAFGLPAEQYAIQTGIHPEETTKKAIKNFRRQLKSFGFSFDWSREISTCDPKFYKWTQFLFTKFFKKNLIYKKEATVNWCPALRTVLANEEILEGKSERGEHPVIRKPMKQWMIKITAYAERLLGGIKRIDWPEKTKQGQIHWIGKSEGMFIDFFLEGNKKKGKKEINKEKISIFTTRADTLFGVTFIVFAPEHPLVLKMTKEDQMKSVKNYIATTRRKSDVERQEKKNISGAFTGAYALHPLNSKKLPIWISDYVFLDYGTGAVMATPAHDERDFDLAQKFNLPILPVIESEEEIPFSSDGLHINSDFLNGKNTKEALLLISDHLEKRKLGKKSFQYKLRDWIFSRQRYWGEPFPIVYPLQSENTSSLLEKTSSKKASNSLSSSLEDNIFLLPLEELPLCLPEVSDYKPSEEAETPLRRNKEFMQYTFPDGRHGRREADTMPVSAASSWYFLRYTDPHNDKEPFSFEAQKYWMPVDLYIGGGEHTVGHLFYSRFWQKVLYDLGLVSHDEPFRKLVHQGTILASDGQRMSKSRGNVVNPDEIREKYGADVLRIYICFLGPFDKDKPWQDNGIEGVRRFLDRIWRLCMNEKGDLILEENTAQNLLNLEGRLKVAIHRTIKKVTEDIESMHFNTAISSMMELVNLLYKLDKKPKVVLKSLVQLLAPFAPHFAEELWEKMGETSFVSLEPWPEYDFSLAKESKTTLGVQVNGRLKGTIQLSSKDNENEALKKAKEIRTIQLALKGKDLLKVIYKEQKILNLIIK